MIHQAKVTCKIGCQAQYQPADKHQERFSGVKNGTVEGNVKQSQLSETQT